MYSDKPRMAFGRYPCCNAMRPLPIPEKKYVPVHETCPSCGTSITRVFNGFLHVISIGDMRVSFRHEPCPAFHTRRGKVRDGASPQF